MSVGTEELRGELGSPRIEPKMQPPTDAPISEAAVEAWDQSFLGSQTPPALSARLLQDARETEVEANEIVHRVAPQDGAVLIVVVSGLLRIYTSSAQGRQVTVRYVSAAEAVGLPTILAPGLMGERLHLAVQALTDAHLLRISSERMRAVIAKHPEMAQPVFEELTSSLMNSYELLVENVFMPVRQRIARHILDLAVRDGGRLVVRSSQQSIADSIASVREVVSRVILRMRDEGLIKRIPDGYLILDPARLHKVAKTPE